MDDFVKMFLDFQGFIKIPLGRYFEMMILCETLTEALIGVMESKRPPSWRKLD